MIYNVFVNAENRMETDPHKTVLSRSRQSFGWHERASGGLPSCQGAESSGNFGSKFFVNVFFSGFLACSFWENIVIVGRDHKICNFVDLYNQQVEATSKKLQLHRWNELMGCGEPTCGTDAWWDGGRFKDISRDPDLARSTAGFLLIWSTVLFYPQILLMQLSKTQHSDFEFSCFAFQ